MTTSIRIDLPIAPGAKTCEGCPHHRWILRDACALYRDANGDPTDLDTTPAGSHPRLPECLAAERRELASECWYVRYPDRCRSTPFARRKDAAYYRDTYCTGHLSGSKLVHVRRYRRAK